MGSLDHRSLTSSGAAAEGVEGDTATKSAASTEAQAAPVASFVLAAASAAPLRSSATDAALERTLSGGAGALDRGVDSVSDAAHANAEAAADDGDSDARDAEHSDRAEALASAPAVDLEIRVPRDPAAQSAPILHSPPAPPPPAPPPRGAAADHWTGPVECPGLAPFHARLTPRTSLAQFYTFFVIRPSMTIFSFSERSAAPARGAPAVALSQRPLALRVAPQVRRSTRSQCLPCALGAVGGAAIPIG